MAKELGQDKNGGHVRLSPTACREDRREQEISDRANETGKTQRHCRCLRLKLFLP